MTKTTYNFFKIFLHPFHYKHCTLLFGLFRNFSRPTQSGCIDCTHIAIIRPGGKNEHPEPNSVNTKEYHSKNVQLVRDLSSFW